MDFDRLGAALAQLGSAFAKTFEPVVAAYAEAGKKVHSLWWEEYRAVGMPLGETEEGMQAWIKTKWEIEGEINRKYWVAWDEVNERMFAQQGFELGRKAAMELHQLPGISDEELGRIIKEAPPVYGGADMRLREEKESK